MARRATAGASGTASPRSIARAYILASSRVQRQTHLFGACKQQQQGIVTLRTPARGGCGAEIRAEVERWNLAALSDEIAV
eukprot:4496860-Pleurochrysis_carterae.AAC.1